MRKIGGRVHDVLALARSSGKLPIDVAEERRRHGSDGPSVSRPEERGVPTPPTVPDTLTTTTATRPVRLDDKYAATSGASCCPGSRRWSA